MPASDPDYVIVGAGSAGCVLARRLSDDPAAQVCLLESGGSDDCVLVRCPAGFFGTVPRRLLNWAFETVPQEGLARRRGYQPRGKVLGGSSSINAMIYIRGQPEDYDAWDAAGCPGWAWKDVLPYFLRAENREAGAGGLHASGGPLNVARLRSPNPVGHAFIDAAVEAAGLQCNDDFNGARQDGAGEYEVTQLNGERCSASSAYLAPARGRPNLDIRTEAHATRILFEGRRAVAVEYRRAGRLELVRARREVILAAGSFGSPQLLMLSGIGPKKDLQKHGIEVLCDRRGVGENLHDHPAFYFLYRSPSSEPLGLTLGMLPRLRRAICEWRRSRTGMLTTNYSECGAFVRSDPKLPPDLQLTFVIGIVDDHGRKLHFCEHGYSCNVGLLQPRSRGSVQLASNDPFQAPLIDPAFLKEEADLKMLRRGYEVALKILEADALKKYRGTRVYAPDDDSDKAIERFIRERTDSIYHPVGTCRMGSNDDAQAVLDPQLRVRGMQSLSVADASVMPRIVSGNINAAVIMIAEKAADLVRARHP